MKIDQYEFFKNLTLIPQIQTIWLFGSRAREDHSQRADIDLAIDCSNATDDDWQGILDIVEDADTLLMIDCIRLDTLSPSSALGRAIQSQGVKIYERV